MILIAELPLTVISLILTIKALQIHFLDFAENSVNILDILGIPRIRENKDLVKNRYGTLLLEFCKGNNFFILNGRLDGDKHGNYTCKNVSVVDYCICNASFVNIFVTLKVLEFLKLFSDVYCPFINLFKCFKKLSCQYN